MAKKRYSAKDITVLEGLEAVRRRPAMYIGGVGSEGLHHLVWELVDNSVDEAINGHASTITVRLHRDGESITVEDDGRGIPVDRHAKYKKSALELILTTLHAGGKFEAQNYLHSGGLHGVGASVVNALAAELVATVRRDGAEWTQRFSKGKPRGPVKKGRPARKTGTSIFFRPDDEIFPERKFDAEVIRERLEARAYLHKGVQIRFENDVDRTKTEWKVDEGLRAWLGAQLEAAGREAVGGQIFYLEKTSPGDDAGSPVPELECAVAWTEGTTERIQSFANGIPTRSGGTHENGFKAALTKAVRNVMERNDKIPRGLTIAAEDVREGVVAILSCYLIQPQFQGQTKDRLNNPESTAIVEAAVRSALENFLLHEPTVLDAVCERVVLAAKARAASRAAAKEVTRKSAVSHRLNLPGKLADCTSTDPSESELFIVEGDSAGGSAKQGRERRFQAILPLRGKVLNTETARVDKVMANRELADLVKVLGCGMGKTFRIEGLRYHKICLLMDADSDGNHITILLLTFFFRHLPELVEGGYVYIAQPPLYRIDVGKETHWALDDATKEAIVASAGSQKVQIMRFKGLGEMNPKTLRETTLDPATRTLLKVEVDDRMLASATLRKLMGRDVAPRFEFIMERAAALDGDVLDI